MKIVHALQAIEPSIFLAGPTPRDETTQSWRPEALQLLTSRHFEGTVYVPESADWSKHDHYTKQVEWEWAALNTASVIVFWIPRDLSRTSEGVMRMPAFTTNVEFGLYADTGKCILGSPHGAQKNSYLEALALKKKIPVVRSLEALIDEALYRCNKIKKASEVCGH